MNTRQMRSSRCLRPICSAWLWNTEGEDPDGLHWRLVGAETKSKAREILGLADLEVRYRKYVFKTGAKIETAVALAKPGVVFRSATKNGGPWVMLNAVALPTASGTPPQT